MDNKPKKKRKPSQKSRFGEDLKEVKRLITLTRMDKSDKESLIKMCKKYIDKDMTLCFSCREQIIYTHRRLKNFYEYR